MAVAVLWINEGTALELNRKGILQCQNCKCRVCPRVQTRAVKTSPGKLQWEQTTGGWQCLFPRLFCVDLCMVPQTGLWSHHSSKMKQSVVQAGNMVCLLRPGNKIIEDEYSHSRKACAHRIKSHQCSKAGVLRTMLPFVCGSSDGCCRNDRPSRVLHSCLRPPMSRRKDMPSILRFMTRVAASTSRIFSYLCRRHKKIHNDVIYTEERREEWG